MSLSDFHNCVYLNKHLESDFFIEIRIGNHILPIVQDTNYLGIFIDSCLTFLIHLIHVGTKLAQYCGITSQTTFKFNVGLVISYYFSFFFVSLLSYGVAVRGGVMITHSCTRTHSLFRRVVLNLFSWHFPGLSYE